MRRVALAAWVALAPSACRTHATPAVSAPPDATVAQDAGESPNGAYRGDDLSTITVTGADAGPPERDRGRVTFALAAGGDAQLTIADDDGGTPCVLRARWIDGAGAIAAGQRCTDSAAEGTLVWTIARGEVRIARGRMVLDLEGPVRVSATGLDAGSAVESRLAYHFEGER